MIIKVAGGLSPWAIGVYAYVTGGRGVAVGIDRETAVLWGWREESRPRYGSPRRRKPYGNARTPRTGVDSETLARQSLHAIGIHVSGIMFITS